VKYQNRRKPDDSFLQSSPVPRSPLDTQIIDLDFSHEIPVTPSQLSATRQSLAKKHMNVEKAASIIGDAVNENLILSDVVEQMASGCLKSFYEMGRYLHFEVSASKGALDDKSDSIRGE
jgi:hypothetical protein